jgi:hypothetical protein
MDGEKQEHIHQEIAILPFLTRMNRAHRFIVTSGDDHG